MPISEELAKVLKDSIGSATAEPDVSTGAEAESPPATDVGAESSPAPDAKAESSPAKDAKDESSTSQGEDRKSLLEVARDAVKPKEAESVKSESPTDKGSETASADDEPVKSESEAEADAEVDDKDLPFNKHPRFRKLVRENTELKGLAEQQKAVRAFMDLNEIPDELAADTFVVSALIVKARKGDAKAAEKLVELLDPVRTEALELLGRHIPEDLAEQVASGDLTEDAAKQIARTRRERDAARSVAAEREQRDERTRETEAVQVRVNAAKQAVTSWEQQARKSDPDFDKKAAFITSEVQALAVSSGPPKSAKEAVELVQKAYSNVNERLKAVLPPKAKPATPKSPNGSAATTGNGTRPQPKSMLDAARLSLESARA